MAGPSRRRGDQLEANRLEAEVAARVHQSTWMNGEEPHEVILSVQRIFGHPNACVDPMVPDQSACGRSCQ